jgi:hypothetical protein
MRLTIWTFFGLGTAEDAVQFVQTSHRGKPELFSSSVNGSGAQFGRKAEPEFFVLNLDRRQDRLASLSERLVEKAPWICRRICRVSAVDGSALPDELDTRYVSPEEWNLAKKRTLERKLGNPGKNLTKGGVGLNLGHALMWEAMLARNLDFAIFMEDDIDIFVNGTILNHTINGFPAANVEYGQMEAGNGFPRSETGEWQDGVVSHLGLYALTREGARRALEGSFPMTYQLDWDSAFLRSNLTGKNAIIGVQAKGGPSDVQIGKKQDGNGLWVDDTSLLLRARCPIPDCKGHSGSLAEYVAKLRTGSVEDPRPMASLGFNATGEGSAITKNSATAGRLHGEPSKMSS